MSANETPAWLAEAMQEMRRAVQVFTETGRLPDDYYSRMPAADPLQSVTQTCTCHCWRNHPERSGICTAASDPGTTIQGAPACSSCCAASRLRIPVIP